MQKKSVCSRTTRLKNKQIKSRKKSFLTLKMERATTRVAIVKTVPQLGCVSQDAEPSGLPKETAPGKPDAKSFGINSTSTIHTVYATPSKYPRKYRTITWTITSQRSLIKKFPALWNLRTSPGETERQERCARDKAWILAKIFTSSKKMRKLHSIRLLKSGSCRPHAPLNRRTESLR